MEGPEAPNHTGRAMLDAAQRTSANAIVDIFEFLDLDPTVNEIAREEGLRYHRYPNGRGGGDAVMEVFSLGLPPSESVQRAMTLSEGRPHWLSPFGELDADDLRVYAAHGYHELGIWDVMHRPLRESPPVGDIPVELVSDAKTEAMLAALLHDREDISHHIRPGQYADPRFIQCWIAVEEVAAAIGQTVLIDGWAYVCDMVTFPDFRRRGFAGAIFHALLGHAYARGAREAILVSTPMAHGLYRSLGFADVVPLRAFEWRPSESV